MSSTHQIEQTITQALTTINGGWAHMLPHGAPPVRHGVGRTARITADDHSEHTGDLDALTVIVSLRRHIIEVLNGWCRLVMEDRPVTRALPDGADALSMCTFLARHAEWMAGHEAGPDMADELTPLAAQVSRITQPRPREWISLGACPLTYEDDTVCGGQVWARPRHHDHDGEVMAQCRRCGTEAVASWWERAMWPDMGLRALLTADEVVTFVHRAYGRVIAPSTVRQWVRRGVITPSGTIDGRHVYDRAAIVWALDAPTRVGA